MLAAVQMGLIRSGKMDVFMGWLERLPQEELVRHPTLPALGALVAAVLSQPAAKTRRLATLADANSHTLVEREQHFIDAAVAMTYAALLDHDLGSALAHAIKGRGRGAGPGRGTRRGRPRRVGLRVLPPW